MNAGAQGTALLQLLPTPYGAAEVQGKAYDEPELLQNSDSLQNSSTITVADMPQLITVAQSPKKSVELLPEMEDAGVCCLCSLPLMRYYRDAHHLWRDIITCPRTEIWLCTAFPILHCLLIERHQGHETRADPVSWLQQVRALLTSCW